tara:strand:+ start:1603 stop:2472 length:870 start_codon:yes stop_codon:yes gene_type:complete
MVFGILGNFNKEEFYEIFNDLCLFLSDKNNVDFYLLENQNLDHGKILFKKSVVDFDFIKNNSDVIISIGGDGTIISTLRKLIETNLPVLGLHIGGLGFLAECNKDSYKDRVNDIIEKKYYVENRMLIEVESDSKKFHSINEVVVNRGKLGRTIKINVSIDNKYVNTYESDGLIFSTPTGSTAYSLSAGGPIVSPELELIIITPICPHTLSMRPLIVPSNEEICISFDKDSKDYLLSLNIDGQIQEMVEGDSKVIIKKSQYVSKIIKFTNHDYYKTLRSKMNWKGNLRFK